MSEIGSLSEQLADEAIAGRATYDDFLEVKAPIKRTVEHDLRRRIQALGEGKVADFVVKKPTQGGMANIKALGGGALALAAGEVIARTPDLQLTIHGAGEGSDVLPDQAEKDIYNQSVQMSDLASTSEDSVDLIRKKKLIDSMRVK